MLTEKDYCDYETCVALKELGFPQSTSLARYALVNKWVDYCTFKKGQLITSEDRFFFNTTEESIIAPLLYLAQKWLRKEKKLIVLVGFDFCPIISEIVYNWVIVVNGNTAKKSSYTYDFYEEALSEGIKEAVKILKENETIHE